MRLSRTVLAAVAATSLSASPLAAQDAATAPAPDDETVATPGRNAAKAEEVDKTAMADLGESERARHGRVAGIAVGYGLVVGSVPGAGVDVYYQPMRNLQVGLTHHSGSIELKSLVDEEPGTKVDKFDMSASLTLLQARCFLGNSFYLGFGLGQRRVESEIAVRAVGIDAGAAGKIEATSTVGNVRIGNQWSWDSGLVVGIDWIGYNAPFGAKSKGSIDPTGSAPQTAELEKVDKDAEDAAETIGKLGTPMLAVLSVGWAF